MFSKNSFLRICCRVVLGAGLGVSIISGMSAQAETSGKKDFLEYCAPCHGASGAGDGPVARELSTKPIDLTLITKNRGSFERAKIKAYVDGRSMPRAHGTSKMPIWGYWFALQATAGGLLQEDRVTIEKQINQRLNDLLDYLQTLQVK